MLFFLCGRTTLPVRPPSGDHIASTSTDVHCVTSCSDYVLPLHNIFCYAPSYVWFYVLVEFVSLKIPSTKVRNICLHDVTFKLKTSVSFSVGLVTLFQCLFLLIKWPYVMHIKLMSSRKCSN